MEDGAKAENDAPVSVCHVLLGTGFGGAERVACTLHRLSIRHGDRSDVIAPPRPELYERLEVELGAPLSIRNPDEKAWRADVRRAWRQNPPDVVHVHLASPSFLGMALRIIRFRPAVLSFHLLPEAGWPKDRWLNTPSDRLLPRIFRIRRSLLGVAVSPGDTPRLEAILPPDRVTCIVNVPPLPPEGGPNPPPVPWRDGALRLLSIGRLVRQKGLDRMLTALAASEIPSWKWMILGDGPDRAALEAQAEALGLKDRVRFLGAFPAHEALREADMVLLPSRFEGMPLVLVEALAAGVPVVASPIAPHRMQLAEIEGALLPETEADWPGHLGGILQPDARSCLTERFRERSEDDPWSQYLLAYRALYVRLSRRDPRR